MKINFLYKLGLMVIVFIAYSQQTNAQLTVDVNMTPDEMAQNIVGDGVDIFNVQVTAADSSFGYYYSSGTEVGTSEGILLTTGKALSAIGPNDETGLPQIDSLGNCLNCDLYDNFSAGDPLLTIANGGIPTWDACKFEFDIVAQGDSLSFDFSFASEEYLEWVGSPFNDVFGFFITGPNGFNQVNIALVPGTSTSVAINTVNNVDNSAYFYDNQDPLGQDIQYDGLTTGLRAEVGGLAPCEVYHLELIIADGSDRIYDSGVFISKIESNPVTLLSGTAGGIDYMIEGCNDGTVSFESSFPGVDPLDVFFTVSGPAILDVDYTTDPDINDWYDGGTETYTITIPAGETSASFDINTIFDGLDEDLEYVTITLVEQFCDTALFSNSIDFFIVDSLEVAVHPDVADLCPGQCIPLTGEALEEGSATWFWEPIEGLDDPNSLTPIACPEDSTTYVLTSMIADCVASDSIEVAVTPLEFVFDVDDITCDGTSSGNIDVEVLFGTEPFIFEWSGPNGFTSADEDLFDLEEGTYCVTVTDAVGCSNTDCIDIIEIDVLDFSTVDFSDFTCFPISCNGVCDGAIDVAIIGGVIPYTFNWTGPSFTSSDQNISSLCAGEYFLTVTDSVGCEITDSWILEEPDILDVQLDGQVDVLCNGSETGSACVTATGGCTPYFYDWSHDANLTAPCAIELASSTYTVQVSDVNGCTSQDSVIINIGEPGSPISVTIDDISVYPGGYSVSCPDASDGSIDITIAGGTPNYFVQWNETVSGNTYFTQDLANIPCGVYDLIVTDDNDCIYTETVIMTCVPDIGITSTTVPNPCGDPNAGLGEIHITSTFGGNGGPYVLNWISGPSCPCAGADLVGLDSGNYVLEVEDAQGCTEQFVISVGMNDSFTVTPTITDTECFNTCTGSIELDIDNADPTTYDWSGPNGFTSSDEDIFDLCSGDYSVIVTQGTCEETYIYTVGAPADIVLTVDDATPPSCFGQNDGSIAISVSGGTGALVVDWPASPDCFFGGSNALTLNNLFECDYIVNVTDDNGCTLTDTVSLVAPQVMDIFVEVTNFEGGLNVSCAGAQDGQISVSVSGGTPDCVGFAPYCYLYDWSDCIDITQFGNDANSPNLTNLPGGTYCINVTDSAGCLATTTIELLEPEEIDSAPILSDYNGFNISCNGESDGWIVPNIIGGNGNFDYDWSNGDDIGANAADADTLLNLPAGTYCVSILDGNDCTDTSCFTLIEPDTIAISLLLAQDISCFGYTDGVISVDATGGTGVYTYAWAGPGGPYAGSLLTGLGAGVYVLTVTDENDCSNTMEVELMEPDLFDVTLTAPFQGDTTIFTLSCVGDSTASIISFVEGGVPGFTYLWEDCDNNFVGNTSGLESLGAGCYNIIVTDSLGCEATASIDITEPTEELTVTSVVSEYFGGFNTSCFGICDASIDLTVSGGVPNYTYIWELGGDTLSFDEDLIELCQDDYVVLITDANGCDTLIQFEIISPPPIMTNVSSSQYNGGFNVSCFGECDGSLATTPTGGVPGYIVLWGEPLNTDSLAVSDLCAGTYSLSVTDSSGCEIIEFYELLEPDSITFTPTVSDIQCFGDDNGSINAGISGGNSDYTIVWIPDVGDTETISGLTEDTYCIDVTDSNNCNASDCWDITEPEELDASSVVTDADCGQCNGEIDVTASGGTGTLDYDWTGADINQGEEDQIELCPGDFTLLISDENDCTVNLDVNVDGPLPIVVEEIISQPLCYDDCDGEIVLDIQNATEPFTVIWLNEQNEEVGNGNTLDGICNGTYVADIEDADGCTNSFDYTIFEPDSITINGSSPFYDNDYNVSAFGENDGSIGTDVSGGTPQYTYEWDGPTSINDGETDPEDLVGGSYVLTITDANGCEKDTVIIITEPYDLELPTGLSPNGDGANDTYVIHGVEAYPDNTFIVFNRWGNKVYEKNNYQNEWAGDNTNGDDLPDGTYYIIFEAQGRDFNTYVDLRR